MPKPSLKQRVAAHPILIACAVVTFIIVILAIVLGVYFGLHNRQSASPAPSGPNTPTNVTTISVPDTAPQSDYLGVQEAFVSFAIEFFFFPDYAGMSPLGKYELSVLIMVGNSSSPNIFSDNLLNNLGNISGTKPYVRVGGNSADLAIYEASVPTATRATWRDNGNDGISPQDIQIGPSFFEAYGTWPGVKFIHGLNLKNASNSALGWHSLLNQVSVACQALEGGKLLWWEYGNEPDYYPRPPSQWNDGTFVLTWGNGTTAIRAQLSRSCPDMASDDSYGYVGPSLAEVKVLPPVGLLQNGLNTNDSIKQYTMHQYFYLITNS